MSIQEESQQVAPTWTGCSISLETVVISTAEDNGTRVQLVYPCVTVI